MPNTFWDRNSSSRAQKEITRIAALAELDPKSVNILFNTYFDADDRYGGWIENPKTPADDLAYARAQGVMAASVELDHDQLVAWLIEQRDRLDRGRAAAAFVTSLRTGRPDFRSALGSYAVFLHLEPHGYIRSGRHCAVCGLEGKGTRWIDRNSSAFVRLKWAGSVHHAQPDYAADDMAWLAGRGAVEATEEDRQVFADILDAIRALPEDAELRALEKSIAGLFKADKTGRQLVLEILGYCGVLQPQGRPSFREQLVTWKAREADAPSHVWKQEWQWPVQHWTGKDGVNQEAVRFWFGHG